jgi:carboxyl-terminal processing protease
MLREEVVQDELDVRSAVIQNGKDKIGYIWLPDFYANFEDENGAPLLTGCSPRDH